MLSKKLILPLLAFSLVSVYPINATQSNQIDTLITATDQANFQPAPAPIVPRNYTRWERFVHATERHGAKILLGAPAAAAVATAAFSLCKNESLAETATISAMNAGSAFLLSFMVLFGITESLD